MTKPINWVLLCFSYVLLSACSSYSLSDPPSSKPIQLAMSDREPAMEYDARLPQRINTNEKVILVNPNVHAWGAYDSSGNLIRSGLATAGSSWCSDIKRRCRTRAGQFRIHSLGNASCKSSIYPLPRGGAPMPYCMFFNGSQGLHGSPASHVVEGNISHGCVRLHIEDARWIRYDFATIGTKVIVKPY